MSPALIRVCALLLLLPLGSAGTLAQDGDQPLEAWQRRILEALEEAGDPLRNPSREESPQSYRGTAGDEAAAAAAERARKRYGGRVLAVGRVGDGYRVRLLLDDGRVMTVEVAE